MSRRVFLSYARADEPRVRRIYRVLKFAGFSPWMDRPDLEGGVDWETKIDQGIRHSGAFLSFVSLHTANPGPILQKETDEAIRIGAARLEGEGFLIPVRLDDVTPPPALAKYQYVDWHKRGHWPRLLLAVTRKVLPVPWIPALLALALATAGWAGYDRLGPNSAYYTLAAARGNGRSLRQPGPVLLGYTLLSRGVEGLMNLEVVTDATDAYLTVYQAHLCEACPTVGARVRLSTKIPAGEPIRVFETDFALPASILPGYRGTAWTFVLSNQPPDEQPPGDPQRTPCASSTRPGRPAQVFRSTQRPAIFRVEVPLISTPDGK